MGRLLVRIWMAIYSIGPLQRRLLVLEVCLSEHIILRIGEKSFHISVRRLVGSVLRYKSGAKVASSQHKGRRFVNQRSNIAPIWNIFIGNVYIISITCSWYHIIALSSPMSCLASAISAFLCSEWPWRIGLGLHATNEACIIPPR
jgi:hypothetical protein